MRKPSALEQVYAKVINTLMSNKGQGEVVSPLPPENTLTGALANYLQIQQHNDASAHTANEVAQQNPQPSASPTPFQFPEWVSNAPNEKQKRALQIVRASNPNLKMTDADIIALYNKYGDHMLKGLSGAPTVPTEASTTNVEATPTQTPDHAVLGASAPIQQMHQELSALEARTLPTFQKFNIPPAVAYGIAGAEGGNIGNNNVYNMGAVDSNPDAAFHYDSPEAAATSAAKLMQTMIKKRGAVGKPAGTQLQAIQDSGYAGDPRTWKQRSIKTGGAGNIFNSWSDFVQATPTWKKWDGS